MAVVVEEDLKTTMVDRLIVIVSRKLGSPVEEILAHIDGKDQKLKFVKRVCSITHPQRRRCRSRGARMYTCVTQ